MRRRSAVTTAVGQLQVRPGAGDREEHAVVAVVAAEAADALPEQQRRVITLRDVKGCSAEEVCNALELSETNQRVLLHRARTKVRQALEDYLTTSEHQESR
jgi:RNA polymerase sigma-70 factor, ECF subfamily